MISCVFDLQDVSGSVQERLVSELSEALQAESCSYSRSVCEY